MYSSWVIIRTKARDTEDPAKITRSCPVFICFSFGVCVTFSKSASDLKLVVLDLKRTNYENNHLHMQAKITLLKNMLCLFIKKIVKSGYQDLYLLFVLLLLENIRHDYFKRNVMNLKLN